ncbi:MAG: hypothetical protein HY719_12265 [Planctomycetes bacterium]|nr:hypothetical protein [Planctomycetota bacterium]
MVDEKTESAARPATGAGAVAASAAAPDAAAPQRQAYRLKIPRGYHVTADLTADVDDFEGLEARIRSSGLPGDRQETLLTLMRSGARHVLALFETFHDEVLSKYFPAAEIIAFTKHGTSVATATARMKGRAFADLEKAGKIRRAAFLDAGKAVLADNVHALFPVRAHEGCYGAVHVLVQSRDDLTMPRRLLGHIVADCVNSFLKHSGNFTQLLGYESKPARFPGLRVVDVSEGGMFVEFTGAEDHVDVIKRGKRANVTMKVPEIEKLAPFQFQSPVVICHRKAVRGAQFGAGLRLTASDHLGEDAPDPAALEKMKALAYALQRIVAREKAERRK